MPVSHQGMPGYRPGSAAVEGAMAARGRRNGEA